MGFLRTYGPEGSVELRADTVNCCHCNKMAVVKATDPKQAEKGRYCPNCAAFSCDSRECHVCVPLLKRIEQMEARDRSLRSMGI